MSASSFVLLPLLIGLIYIAVFIGILYLIYKWVTKFISLREEQNEILREIANKLDAKP